MIPISSRPNANISHPSIVLSTALSLQPTPGLTAAAAAATVLLVLVHYAKQPQKSSSLPHPSPHHTWPPDYC